MRRGEVAQLTYREMWETYVEPILKAQAEIRKDGDGPALPADGPRRPEDRIIDAQSVGMLFGMDPLEIGKAMRKSGKPDLEAMREKLLAREKGNS